MMAVAATHRAKLLVGKNSLANDKVRKRLRAMVWRAMVEGIALFNRDGDFRYCKVRRNRRRIESLTEGGELIGVFKRNAAVNTFDAMWDLIVGELTEAGLL